MVGFIVTQYHYRAQRQMPGLLLALLIALTAIWLSMQPVMARFSPGALTLAMILGCIVGNTLYTRVSPQCERGIQLAKQHLLRAGIVLYGFRLTVQQIADVGVASAIIDALTLCSTFFLACWLGRRVFGLDNETRWLIGAGSSICGAAAVLATAPVIRADSAKVAVAIATVVIFGTLAIFIYPLMWPLVSQWLPWLHAVDYGVYTGSTLHEVAQVVAAGHAIGPEAENAAVVTKLLRVMMLAPFLLFLAARMRGQQAATRQGAIAFPWFALLFIGVALFNSLHWLPETAITAIRHLDDLLLAMAMAALGLSTRFSAFRQAGLKPLLLGLVLFLWLMVGGGSINLLVQQLMA